MKKILATILALGLALSLLTACGSGGNSTTTAAPEVTSAAEGTTAAEAGNESAAEESTEDTSNIEKTLVIGVGTGLPAPGWKEGAGSNLGGWCMNMLRDQYPIYRIVDPTTNEATIYKVLVKDWEEVDENTYDVEIRHGIYDYEGNEIDVNDFVYSISAFVSTTSNPTLLLVEDVSVVDDDHFRLVLNGNQRAGDLLDILANPMIKDQSVIERDGDSCIVGTTGFKMTQFESGVICRYEKAENGYWNEAANETKSIEDGYCPMFDYGDIEAIEFRIITDTTAMALALENGEIDIALGLSNNDAITLGSTGNFNVSSRPDNMIVLTMNANKAAVTSNENLRMALLYGIDANGVLAMAYSGEGEVLHAWAHPSYDDYNSAWDSAGYFDYDLDLAKEYLDKFYKETGTNANTLSLRLITQNGGVYNKAAQAVQSYIVELVGNDTCLTIESYDRGTFNTTMADETAFEMLLLPCQSTTRSVCIYNYCYYLDLNRNASDIFHVNDSKMQELLDVAASEDTHSVDTVDAFQTYLNDQAFCKGLTCGVVYSGCASWITNIEHLPGAKNSINYGALQFDWANSGKPEK